MCSGGENRIGRTVHPACMSQTVSKQVLDAYTLPLEIVFFFCARRSFRSAVWSGSTSERRLATDGSDCVTAICAVFTTSARYIARLHSQCHTRLILATINLVNLIPSWYHVAVSRCRIHSDSPPTIAEAWCHTVSRSHTRRRSQRSQQVFRAESSRVVG